MQRGSPKLSCSFLCRLPQVAWFAPWAERNRSILALTDRGSILLIVYATFSASVVEGLRLQVPLERLATLFLVDATLLASALVMMITVCRVLGFDRSDESAIVFCGSQKSVVSGIPIASTLISGPALGLLVLPTMIYHSMQLLVCTWLAKRYAKLAPFAPSIRDTGQLEARS